jgi:hypothetical protein
MERDMARERSRVVERHVEHDRDQDRDRYRGVRTDVQDVWESGRDIWDGSCHLLSNLVIGIGEACAPPTYYRRTVEREHDDGGDTSRTTTVRKTENE